jgi:hypothetical protein
MMYNLVIFLAGSAGQGVLSKDPIVWLDGARPAHTYTPPSFMGNVTAQLRSVPTQKIHLQVLKN